MCSAKSSTPPGHRLFARPSPSRPVSRASFNSPNPPPILPASSQFPLRPCLFLSLTTSFSSPQTTTLPSSPPPRRRFQLISLLLFPPPPLGRAGCWTRGESVRVVYRIDFVPLKQPTSLCSSLRTNVSMRSMASKHGKLLLTLINIIIARLITPDNPPNPLKRDSGRSAGVRVHRL